MKKDTIKRIVKLIQIFIVTNVLCTCTALLFYGFLVFMLTLFAIPDLVQNCIFTFCLLALPFILAFINLFVFFNEFGSKESSDDN